MGVEVVCFSGDTNLNKGEKVFLCYRIFFSNVKYII